MHMARRLWTPRRLGSVVMGSMRFTAEPASARAARNFVRERLAGVTEPAVDDIVTLLTSELVTNTVRYSQSGGEVRVDVDERVVRVAVSDSDTELPMPGEPAPADEEGRGLWLVSRLADTWGAEPVPDAGKVVWFEVVRQGRSDLTREVKSGGEVRGLR
jgi:anti-sigma regulatory factor (Ser/Thr protein kinase)